MCKVNVGYEVRVIGRTGQPELHVILLPQRRNELDNLLRGSSTFGLKIAARLGVVRVRVVGLLRFIS